MPTSVHPHAYTLPAARPPIRRIPPSPPGVDHDAPRLAHPGTDFPMTSPTAGYSLATSPERARFQPRRTPSLSYQNSTTRDVRDRGYSRSPKNLIVVIPPPDFPLHHGQLGNILSMGPRHRLSQGILMPLFPSMFGQLNAIAREYNFPSTVGLCLYLHINENGILMTPRISDDSWQYLFGHLFDARPPQAAQLPIGGSIEFDIDLNKARWFDAWLSGALRDSEPFPPLMVSQASPGHWREETHTMRVDELDDQWDTSGSHTLVTNSRPAALRHLPKKLSLVDRLESHGPHASPGLQNYPDRPDSPQTHGTDDFSPAPQSAVPQVSKTDLEYRVNSWRATTELYPLSMKEAYQPAPDVKISVGVTSMDKYALECKAQQEVHIDDFIWSLTSVGPRTPDMKSTIPSSRPSSIHLDRRANGTAPYTPTTVTSWGPADDEWCFTISSVSRLPSPDIGERIVEDIMAPTSRSIWGNSFGWRSAMTWKEVYPYSVAKQILPVRVQLPDFNGLVPLYPILIIYPAMDLDGVQSLHDAFARPQISARSVWEISFGWQRGVSWKKVYPYSTATLQSIPSVQLATAGLTCRYPNICIYPAIYPYFEIYPPCPVEKNISVIPDVSVNSTTHYPILVIYPAMYPCFDIYPPVSGDINMKELDSLNANICSLSVMSTSYPNFVIYPVVYPYFDIYPQTLRISEAPKGKEVVVDLTNASCLVAKYPNLTIYPSTYPYLDIYPIQHMKTRTLNVTWGISFGWVTAKTWLHVYPLHIAPSITGHSSRSVPESHGQNPVAIVTITGKPAVWGGSFGWKNVSTWRAVWPTARVGIQPNVGPVSLRLGDASSSYPFLSIYPAVYPHFDVYPTCSATVESERVIENGQCTVHLIHHYPGLVIYPAAYPHMDVYPPFAKIPVDAVREKKQPNALRRRVEMWRAKTAAQVGLVDLLANDHIWEADEPLRIDVADYAWSRTSAGPLSLIDSPLSLSALQSVHLDRRIQGSVPLTPSTATTWGPRDDDLYSDISSIERLPSPDLGQRVLDDAENPEFPYQPWYLSWPFFKGANHAVNLPPLLETSVFIREYPHLVVYPPAYPHLELYPSWTNVSIPTNLVAEGVATNSDCYSISSLVYPHFDIYPPVDSRIEISKKTVEQVEVKLPTLYPNFDIYHPCYPYNLDYIYPLVKPIEFARASIDASDHLSVVYLPAFSLTTLGPMSDVKQRSGSVLPEWKPINVKLLAPYPTLEIYAAGYPWSLDSIYPAISVDDDDAPGELKPQYPCIRIYAPVYPFVEPYPVMYPSVDILGSLGEDKCESAEVFPASSEVEHIKQEFVVHPYFDLYSTLPTPSPQQEVVQDIVVEDLAPHESGRTRKTHVELHIAVFRCLEKRPARNLKTHNQLHTEVFQDGIVWTPSGYVQDLSPPTPRKREEVPIREYQPRRPSRENSRRPGAYTVPSPEKVVFPLAQSPVIPPLSPFRVHSPGVPSQPSPAVSETPMLRVSSPTNAFSHRQTTSSRLTQAVKSMMPGTQRRNSSTAPLSEETKESVKDQHAPTRFLSLADRRPTVVSPLSHTGNNASFLARSPRTSERKESTVLQRARAYEQSAGERLGQATSGAGSLTGLNQPGTKETSTAFILPPLPPMPAMTDVVETFDISKTTLF